MSSVKNFPQQETGDVAAAKARIVIGINNTLTNDPCALCGARTDPDGIDLMLADSLSLVCDDCGMTYVRPLAMLLRLRNAARTFTSSDMGEDVF
jgi:hypothetical protein